MKKLYVVQPSYVYHDGSGPVFPGEEVMVSEKDYEGQHWKLVLKEPEAQKQEEPAVTKEEIAEAQKAKQAYLDKRMKAQGTRVMHPSEEATLLKEAGINVEDN